jgi:membrane protein DedA with SNARE-associated domain
MPFAMPLEVVSLDAIQGLASDYGYWAIFGGILLENMGIPVPGETITIVGGFLAGSGELTYPGVLGSTVVGAIVGDNIGYWLGRWGGWASLVRVGRFFKVEEAQLERIRSQFMENADKAVFLGRFITLLRVFAGPLAGIVGMPYGRFLLCNGAGAAVWATAIVSLAYFVGQVVPLPQILTWVTQFGVAALALAAAFVALSWWREQRKVNRSV